MALISISTTDLATQYAHDVYSGAIIAGPHVRDTCDRHIKDLERSDLRWDVDTANHKIGFYKDVLQLNGGEFEGIPFELLLWEAFIVGCLFGWKGLDGYRRFRTAYIETGKGSGKSPLVAGIGIIMLTIDDEARAEVYAAAVKKDQAKVLFRDAVAMVTMSPELSRRLIVGGGQNPANIGYPAKESFFRPISSEERGRGQSGPRPHCALLDEIHEHPTNVMVEMMRLGTKGRRQALICMITNSGSDKQTPCWEYHEYAVKVCKDEIQDDAFFGYVCALDEEDDPFEDESCWIKANPSLPVIPGVKYLRELVHGAKGLPSTEAMVRRLNFCEWVEGVNPLFDRQVWMSALADLNIADYKGKRCVGALDLSSRVDLTALAIAFENGEYLDVFIYYWTPADTLKERSRKDRAPYDKWVTDGYITAVPGKSIKYAWVADSIKALRDDYEFELLGFDRWKIDQLISELDDYGVEHHLSGEAGYGLEMMPFGQGFKDMSPAIDTLEERVLNKTIRIQRNPVTTMCAANCAVTKDPAENRKFEKSKSTGRIDGMVTLAMVARVGDMMDEIDSYTASHGVVVI